MSSPAEALQMLKTARQTAVAGLSIAFPLAAPMLAMLDDTNELGKWLVKAFRDYRANRPRQNASLPMAMKAVAGHGLKAGPRHAAHKVPRVAAPRPPIPAERQPVMPAMPAMPAPRQIPTRVEKHPRRARSSPRRATAEHFAPRDKGVGPRIRPPRAPHDDVPDLEDS